MTSISYIIYIHNHAPYIEELFTSLKSQKGTHRKEFIIIDDGSTDDSLSLIKKHLPLLTKATILLHEHMGSAASINKALSIASYDYVYLTAGSYIVSADASQLLLNTCLEHQIDIACATGKDDKHYYKRMTPLFDVINSLRQGIGQIGLIPTIIRTSLLEEAFEHHINYNIAPSLALYIAQHEPIFECPVSYKGAAGMSNNREEIYNILAPLLHIVDTSPEQIETMRRELFVQILLVIKDYRRLSIMELLQKICVKYTKYTPPIKKIRNLLKEELRQLI